MSEEQNENIDLLTDKQKRFVEQYCIHFNGSRAAREAGYSEDSSKEIASENLTKPNIKAAIDARLAELSMTAEEATKRLADMARGSIESFLKVDDNGNVIFDLSSNESKANLSLIKKLKQTKRSFNDGTIIEVANEVELHDQKDAIIQILKMHGKYTGKGEDDGKGVNIEYVEINL